MHWKKHYKVVKVKPGIVIIPGFGRVDLSDEKHKLEYIKKIHESGCPYLHPVTEQEKEQESEIAENTIVENNNDSNDEDSMNSRDILDAILEATTAEDARKFAEMRPDNKKIQTAYERKLNELNANDTP